MDYKEKQQAVDKLSKVLSRGLYSDTELSVIAETFFENEDLLTALRNFFLQFQLTEREQTLIDAFAKTPAYDVLYKTFLPELSPDAPIGRSVDLWAGVNTTEKLPEDSVLEMKSREKVINYLEEQFRRMTGNKDIGDISLDDLIYTKSKSAEQAFVDLSARNSIIGQVNGNLMNLRSLAFQEKTKMTPDEINKIMKINSNK